MAWTMKMSSCMSVEPWPWGSSHQAGAPGGGRATAGRRQRRRATARAMRRGLVKSDRGMSSEANSYTMQVRLYARQGHRSRSRLAGASGRRERTAAPTPDVARAMPSDSMWRPWGRAAHLSIDAPLAHPIYFQNNMHSIKFFICLFTESSYLHWWLLALMINLFIKHLSLL